MTPKILALTDALAIFCRRSSTDWPLTRLSPTRRSPATPIFVELDARGVKVVISQHPRRAKTLAIDEEMYKWRHLVESFLGRLTEFKRIAMRAESSFASMIHLAAAVINSG